MLKTFIMCLHNTFVENFVSRLVPRFLRPSQMKVKSCCLRNLLQEGCLAAWAEN